MTTTTIMQTTAIRFTSDRERKTFEIGMAEARRKGYRPPATIQEREARTMREGLAIVRKKLEAARPVKSLAAPAAATVTPATVAAFKRGLVKAIKPTLLEAIKAKATPPAPPARRTLHRIFHRGLW
jgi:hypothetical protein